MINFVGAARAQFDPMREKVDSFLSSTNDPAVYYDRLSRDALEGIEQTDQLPPIAVQWAREAEDRGTRWVWTSAGARWCM